MRRFCAVAACAAALLFGAAPYAAAHGLPTGSSPADGAILTGAPTVITLDFTEPPEPSLTSVNLRTASGSKVAVEVGSVDNLRVNVKPPPLDDGVYLLAWRIVSRLDGHLTSGTLVFGVNADPTEVDLSSVEETSAPVDPIEVASRALFLMGAGLLLGAASLIGIVGIGDEKLGRLIRWSATAALAGSVGLLVAGASVAGGDIVRYVSSGIGRLAAIRVGLSAAALAIATSRDRTPRWAATQSIAVAALLYGHILGGHASARGVWGIWFQWIHVSAASIWIGGLAALLIAVKGEPGFHKAEAVRRFSRLAGITLGVVAITGFIRGFSEVRSFAALVGTGYGRFLGAKTILVGLIALLGWVNRRRWVPVVNHSLSGLRKTSRVELWLAGIVILLTVVIAGSTPAVSEWQANLDAKGVEVTATDFSETVKADLEIRPGIVGVNEFNLTLDGTDAERVALRLTPPEGTDIPTETIELTETDGVWTARSGAVAAPGTWDVTVLVESSTRSRELKSAFRTKCDTTRTVTPGLPTIHDSEIASGGSVQAYLDPGKRGRNDVHFTFFGPDGNEVGVSGVVAIAGESPTGRRVRTEVRQFSPGHFVGAAEFNTRGVWRFSITAAIDNQEVSSCFEESL